MRILLVEDHDDLAAAVIDRFGWKGRAIDREADGTEAAALLRHAEVDPVLIDVDLPGLAGAEVLRGMRARGEPTPAPLLTARPEVDDRVAGLDASADG